GVVLYRRELVAVDGDHNRDAVVDQHDAVAIEDPAPRRLLEDLALAVRRRLGRELLRRHDLEEPQPREQGAEQRHDDDGENPEPNARAVVTHHKPSAESPHW